MSDAPVQDDDSAKASLETARINLAYTRITAPIGGRTDKSSLTEGALVTADQTTLLIGTAKMANEILPSGPCSGFLPAS